MDRGHPAVRGDVDVPDVPPIAPTSNHGVKSSSTAAARRRSAADGVPLMPTKRRPASVPSRSAGVVGPEVPPLRGLGVRPERERLPAPNPEFEYPYTPCPVRREVE